MNIVDGVAERSRIRGHSLFMRNLQTIYAIDGRRRSARKKGP